MGKIYTQKMQCVVPENIHTPPWKGFAVWPPPLPSGISKIFTQPLEILLSLIEVNKEVVLFTKDAKFCEFPLILRFSSSLTFVVFDIFANKLSW